MAVGRISGPLLFANLERNGIDLSFRNTLNDTRLLYINVNDQTIGVASNTAPYDLTVANTFASTNTKSTTATLGDLNFATNEIENLVGDINFASENAIKVSTFETDFIRINDNTISTIKSNANIELRPNASGIVDFQRNVNTDGNIHATGNITMDGNITVGDAADDSTVATDTLEFLADIASDLVPSTDVTYSLGSFDNRWQRLYSDELTANTTISNNINLSGIDPLTLRNGNILYVGVNGSDSNKGDHPNSPFATIKKALDFADSSTDGPVVIFVAPGEYQEELPLEVPVQTIVVGQDYRNTKVVPDTSSQSEDVFLLNGESAVQNLTIMDFYYDSVNDKGYAFRFANDCTVTTRSPYIQNCTVITKGSTTSASDPRGFDAGDAGKGAHIDGSRVPAESNEANMLFHSVTMITPGVDAVTMTNGVRVEWLNSFSYFANRGLYMVNGSTGHESPDGSTIKYGAELRSIGSANVYGNYGAVADGDDCIMYLIQHNFAYIGVGKRVDNDKSRVIQSQEVTELNNGNIYYQSIDHLGNFRVGDNFEINQETGQTNLVLTEADIDALAGLRVTTNGSTTIIDGEDVDLGNFKLAGNTMQTVSGGLNLDSSTTIEILDNTNILGNLDVTGNVTLGGTMITLGNEATDTVDFNVGFSQDLEPDISGLYNLGSTSKRWLNLQASESNFGDIKIFDTNITTNISNSDLELRANGTGKIVAQTSLQVDNDLTVDGQTTFGILNDDSSLPTIINGNVTQTGNLDVAKDYNITGSISATQDINVSSDVTLEEIKIQYNEIATTTTNADLELRAAGTGKVLIDTNVIINNDLTAGSIDFQQLSVLRTLSAEVFETGDIRIFDNVIETTQSNSPLELRANGTGNVIAEDLMFRDYTIQNGDWTVPNPSITLRTNYTDSVNREDVKITSTGSLQLPNGTTVQRLDNKGDIRFNTTDNLFEGYAESHITFNGVYSDDRTDRLTAHPTENTINMYIDNIEVAEANFGGFEVHGITIDDINIDQNTIRTIVSNSDLELVPNGTGEVRFFDIGIKDNSIINNSYSGTFDNILKLGVTGQGRIKFDDTNGIVVPFGTTYDAPMYSDRLEVTAIISVGTTTVIEVSAVHGLESGDEVFISGVESDIDDALENLNTDDSSSPGSHGVVSAPATNQLELAVDTTGANISNYTPNTGFVVGKNSNTPPVGDTRYNTDTVVLETWDGDTYITSAGVATAISQQEFDDLLLEYTLALG